MADSRLSLPSLMESAKAIVAEYGAKHWTRLREDRIHLVDPSSGEPEDLIGHILARHGIHIPTSLSTASIKRLRRRGIIDLDDDAYEFLLVIQDAQDDGAYWKEALILAEYWMIDRTLPWNQSDRFVA